MQEVVEEALQVAGLECIRGRPVPEDGPGDRQLPGQAARVTQLQRGHGPGEEWPRVADTVPGHLQIRVRVRVLLASNACRLMTRPEKITFKTFFNIELIDGILIAIVLESSLLFLIHCHTKTFLKILVEIIKLERIDS